MKRLLLSTLTLSLAAAFAAPAMAADAAPAAAAAPATATALMGKFGSFLLLTMLFMAVTSAGSAELVAVSSLCTYDIYRTYINPDATGKQILRVSRAVVLAFGCLMGVLATSPSSSTSPASPWGGCTWPWASS